MVCLYSSLEDLVAENDRRYEDRSQDSTMEYVADFPLCRLKKKLNHNTGRIAGSGDT
jgi:hypothetical protein